LSDPRALCVDAVVLFLFNFENLKKLKAEAVGKSRTLSVAMLASGNA
jgi:hypothetical protein